jgi:hypothetical protein
MGSDGAICYDVNSFNNWRGYVDCARGQLLIALMFMLILRMDTCLK